MVNKAPSILGNKVSGKYKNTVAGIIFSVLSMMGLQDAVAQTTTFQDNLKKPNIELAKKDPVINYMYKNIDMYYPDEKGYIDGLFYQFESQTRLDTALVFLNQMYREVEFQKFDDKQKIQVVVCSFESALLGGQFYDRHENEIDDPTFDYIMKFDKIYVEFLKRYFARVEGRMEELLLRIKELDEQSKQLDEQSKQLDEQSKQLDEQSKQLDEQSKQLDEQSKQLDEQSKQLDEQSKQLDEQSKQLDEQSKQLDEQSKQLDEQSKQLDDYIEELNKKVNQNFIEIENMMSSFTPTDIQKSDHLKKLVIDTYNLIIKAKYTPSEHLLKLYTAAQK